MLADLIAAFRQLRRSPMHVVVSTLSLGIGMAIAVAAFSSMKALAFDDVPGIAERSGLIRVRWADFTPISQDDFEVIEQTLAARFSAIAADGHRSMPVLLPTGPVTLPAAFVSPYYFETLGTVAVRGRLLTAVDGRADGAPVVLISERLWRDAFALSEDVLGRTITVGGQSLTIVGVTPAGFPGLLQRDAGRSEAGYPQVWLSQRHAQFPSIRAARAASWLSVVARARPDASLPSAQAEIAALGPRLKGAEGPRGERRRLTSFRAGLKWNERPLEVVLVLGVFLLVPVSVLLIACGNVINLQLSRATDRSRELGVRIALGASTYRLIRMLGIEAVFLAAVAGVIGWRGAIAFLAWAAPVIEMPVTVDLASLVFTFALVVTVVGVAGLAPAWLVSRSAVAAGVRDVRDSGAGHKRFRAALVVAQVAISLALLFSSARGVRSLQILLPSLPPGAEEAVIAEFDVAASHPGVQDSRPFVDAVLQRLDDAPGIAAGFADFVAMNGAVRYWRAADDDGIHRVTAGGFVTGGWFDAFGATFVAGRGFDRAGASPRDAVVNEAFASTLASGGLAALGQTLRVSHPPGAPARAVEVVGIVADGLATRVGRPMSAIYLPMPRQTPSSITLVARGPQIPAAMAAIKAAVSAADPTIPWVTLETLEMRALAPLRGMRNGVWVIAGLGIVALILAAGGLHAVLTYTIRRRTHEIGIRIAVGADTRAIVWLVVRQALGLMMGGLLGGLIIITPLFFVMRMFSDLSPIDPLGMLTPLSLLLAVGVLAAIVPAYRAATVDPIVVLRES